MTAEDKNWLYIGIGLAVTGGAIYWYKNKSTGEQKAFEEPKTIDKLEPPVLATPTYSEQPKTKKPKYRKESNIGGAKNPKYNIPVNVPKATFMYAKGQKLMCNVRQGLTALDVQKKADNTFFTNTKSVKKFNYGEEIGTIVGQLVSQGFVYYVVTGNYEFNSESFDNRYFWINHHEVKGLTPLIKPINLDNVPTLDVTRVLSKGSKGVEVNHLQKLLKIDIDGDFGSKTETALLQQKKVNSISINQF